MSSCWVEFHGSKTSFSTLLIPFWSSSHMTASSPPCPCHLQSDTSHYLVKVGTWSITMISSLSSGISLQHSYSQPTCLSSPLLIFFFEYKWTYFQFTAATHSKSHAPDLAATQNDVSENLNPDILLPEPMSFQIPLLSQQWSWIFWLPHPWHPQCSLISCPYVYSLGLLYDHPNSSLTSTQIPCVPIFFILHME